ncbi:MAG: hypothetical protein N2510_01195 [Ignavibacteria bacterium]|nr:hypothetical protein [Ignavibacteria bacterium]
MEKSKLLEILSHLSKKEISELGEFIKLPCVNKGRSLINFYQAVIRYYPDFGDELSIRKNVYRGLYPGKSYKDHIVRNLFSSLLRMTEEYLAFRNLIKNKITLNRHLIMELTERKAFRISKSVIKKQGKLLSYSNITENYYNEKSLLQLMRIMNNIGSENIDDITDSIKRNIELTIFDFFQRISVIMINIMNYKDNYNIDFSGNLLEVFLNDFDMKGFIRELGSHKFRYENPELAEIYCSLILTMNKKEDEIYYYKLKNLLLKNLDKLSRIEKYNLMVAFGTCTSMKSLTIDRDKYLRELFEIYRIRYISGLYSFSDNQPMNTVFFYSTLRLAIALDELDWAEDFVNEASVLLPVDTRDNMKNFALSEIYFTRKKFRESLNYLSEVQIKNIAFNYEVRSLQLQLYYELEESEAAEYALDAYRHFLSKNKSVSEYFRSSSAEFISVFSRLLKCKVSLKDELLYELEKDIIKCKVPQKKWFIEKFNEISVAKKISLPDNDKLY